MADESVRTVVVDFLRLRQGRVPRKRHGEVAVYADSEGALKQLAEDGTVSDLGGAGGGSVSVTDGSTTVDPATSIDFSGATVTDEGGGVAGVAVGGASSENGVNTFPFAFDTENLSTNDGFPITAASAGDQTVSIDGDHTAAFPADSVVQITGSSEMDGPTPVVSAVFTAGKTVVTVSGSTSDIADGTLHPPIGAIFYTPTSDDVAAGLWLLDAWIQLDTAWDGTTPKADIGAFLGNGPDGNPGTGLFKAYAAVLMDLAADTDTGGYLFNSSTPSLVGLGGALGAAIRIAPGLITNTNPLRVLVSQDGSAAGADPVSAVGSAVLCYRIGKPAA